MTSKSVIKVTPGYGWGWVVAGESRFEVPEPFILVLSTASEGSWSGLISEDGHEFDGMVAVLSKRHADWDGAVNIEIHDADEKSPHSIGHGSIPTSAPTQIG